MTIFNALIRTHHITSRKKVSILKSSAKKLNVFALLRSGGVPGVMYVESSSAQDAQAWVDIVHGLRYKDYHCVAPVAPSSSQDQRPSSDLPGTLREAESVKEFAAEMDRKGLLEWWRTKMGFIGPV